MAPFTQNPGAAGNPRNLPVGELPPGFGWGRFSEPLSGGVMLGALIGRSVTASRVSSHHQSAARCPNAAAGDDGSGLRAQSFPPARGVALLPALNIQRPSLQAPYISPINPGEIPGRNGANRLNPRAPKPRHVKRAGLICKALGAV